MGLRLDKLMESKVTDNKKEKLSASSENDVRQLILNDERSLPVGQQQQKIVLKITERPNRISSSSRPHEMVMEEELIFADDDDADSLEVELDHAYARQSDGNKRVGRPNDSKSLRHHRHLVKIDKIGSRTNKDCDKTNKNNNDVTWGMGGIHCGDEGDVATAEKVFSRSSSCSSPCSIGSEAQRIKESEICVENLISMALENLIPQEVISEKDENTVEFMNEINCDDHVVSNDNSYYDKENGLQSKDRELTDAAEKTIAKDRNAGIKEVEVSIIDNPDDRRKRYVEVITLDDDSNSSLLTSTHTPHQITSCNMNNSVDFYPLKLKLEKQDDKSPIDNDNPPTTDTLTGGDASTLLKAITVNDHSYNGPLDQVKHHTKVSKPKEKEKFKATMGNANKLIIKKVITKSKSPSAIKDIIRRRIPPIFNQSTYLLPLELGWKREVVLRSGDQHKKADVYYYSPTGKKLRSTIKIQEYLIQNNICNLTRENFSYSEQRVNSPNEIIRQAHHRGIKRTSNESTHEELSPCKSKKKWKKKGNNPASGAPQLGNQIATESKQETQVNSDLTLKGIKKRTVLPISTHTPELMINASSVNANTSRPLMNEFNPVATSSYSSPSLTSVQTSSPARTLPNIIKQAEEKPVPSAPRRAAPSALIPTAARIPVFITDNDTGEIAREASNMAHRCTHHCPGQNGRIPSLRCNKCLCLFHPQCVGISDAFAGSSNFTCQDCGGGEVNLRKQLQATFDQIIYPNNNPMQWTANNFPTTNVINMIPTAYQTPVCSSLRLPLPPPIPYVNDESTFGRFPLPANDFDSMASFPCGVTIEKVSPGRTAAGPFELPSASISVIPVSAPSSTITGSTSPLRFSPITSNNRTGHISPIIHASIPVPICSAGVERQQQLQHATPKSILRPVFIPSSDNGAFPLLKNAIMKYTTPVKPHLAAQRNRVMLYRKQNGRFQISNGSALSKRPGSQQQEKKQQAQQQNLQQKEETKQQQLHQQKQQAEVSLQDSKPSSSLVNTDKSHGNSRPSIGGTTVMRSIVKSTLHAPEKRVAHRQLKNAEAKSVMHSLNCGVQSLIAVFKYLKMGDILRASEVCRTWRMLARCPEVWETVTLEDARVNDWDTFVRNATFLSTRHLDVRDMRVNGTDISAFEKFLNALVTLKDVKSLTLGESSPSVAYAATIRLPNLDRFSAEWISEANNDEDNNCCTIDIDEFTFKSTLQSLRLRGVNGLRLSKIDGGLERLSSLTGLTCLAITSMKNLPSEEFEFIANLNNLTKLELGECVNWKENNYAIIGRMKNLRNLRLEFGGEFSERGLQIMLPSLNNLLVLELITFRIPCNFGDLLNPLKKLRQLTVWPDLKYKPEHNNFYTVKATRQITFVKIMMWGLVTSHLRDPELGEPYPIDHNSCCVPFLNYEPISHSSSSHLTLKTRISAHQLMNKLRGEMPHTKVQVIMVPNELYSTICYMPR